MKMDKENVTVKAESTGSLLAMNLILMVLSCVLFVGTTLAWFTDQTSGGVNRIQAGNLEAVLVIGEGRTTTSVPLDPPSGAQPTNTTAVSLKLRKVITETENDQIVFKRISTDATAQENSQEAVWNPGDIFISDVMQVVKASGSVPFDYKLELQIDPDEQSTEPPKAKIKAKKVIDFRIVKVDEKISSLSTGENSTGTYDYGDIADYFLAPVSQPEAAQNNPKETNATEPVLPTIIWSSDNEGQTTPTKVFSSEPTDGEEPVQFVILARLNPNVSVDTNSTDTISNPFNLVVTIKQQLAAKAGDAT